MTTVLAMAETGWPEGEALTEALARSSAVQSRLPAILELLLSTHDHTLFSDAIVARVRGMLTHIATYLLRVQAEATGDKGAEQFASDHGEALAAHLASRQQLLVHCHSLALESICTDRLEALYALDPVLTPLVQDLIESEDAGQASAAMALLAAQARFTQHHKRMELPLSELPGDLFHEAIGAWREFNGGKQTDGLTRAENKLRGTYDEGGIRLALLDRVVTSLGPDAHRALRIEQAGVALFLSALAGEARISREQAALATNEGQIAHMLVMLRSAGLKAEDCEALAMRLHPDADLPTGLEQIGTNEARTMLRLNHGAKG